MKKKTPPKGDTTQTRRSTKRKAELQASAKRDGFNTWSEAITAWKNGDAVLVKSQRDSKILENCL